jgi:hypothetical protein
MRSERGHGAVVSRAGLHFRPKIFGPDQLDDVWALMLSVGIQLFRSLASTKQMRPKNVELLVAGKQINGPCDKSQVQTMALQMDDEECPEVVFAVARISQDYHQGQGLEGRQGRPMARRSSGRRGGGRRHHEHRDDRSEPIVLIWALFCAARRLRAPRSSVLVVHCCCRPRIVREAAFPRANFRQENNNANHKDHTTAFCT